MDVSASKDPTNGESAPKKLSLGEVHSTPRTNRLVSSSYPPPNSPQRNQDRLTRYHLTGQSCLKIQLMEFHFDRIIRSRSSDEILLLAQSSEDLSSQLLSHIIETAQAEMKCDKFAATEEIRKKNEGQFIAKVISQLIFNLRRGLHMYLLILYEWLYLALELGGLSISRP